MIRLHEVVLRRGTHVVLEGASAVIHAGERIAVVGRNGAGKSTLFALIAGRLQEDSGECTVPEDWRIAEVAQAMPQTTQAATQFVLDGDERLTMLHQQLRAAERAADGLAIATAHTALADAGAHEARPRAESLILGLGFTGEQLQWPVNRFSGGWRMRLQLARALMAPSDALLLDEPTNHLDLDALVWLEGWLARYPGTLLIISHDREFLDATTRATLHIERGQVTRYRGNYSAFERQYAEQLTVQRSAWAHQQERIAHLEDFVRRFRAKATKARQAQSRLKALERMERVAPVLAQAGFEFSFPASEELPSPMLAISGACMGYRDGSGGQSVVLEEVRETILAGQRIGILGANGQGKSTLVKTIAGALPPLAGELTAGKGLSIGYFAQREMDLLSAQDSPMQHFARLARESQGARGDAASPQQLRDFLGRFEFSGDLATRPVGQFSGGERARLVLAMIAWQSPNLLVLDEPTNHLDLTTREALSLALGAFDGTVLLVSHDRALLRSVCDTFWLVADGRVSHFAGDVDDYQRHLIERARERTASAPSRRSAAARQPSHRGPHPSAASRPAQPNANRAAQRREAALRRQRVAEQTKSHRRAVQRLEREIDALERERGQLEEELAHASEPEVIARSGKRLKSVRLALTQAEDDWLAHSSAIDKIAASAANQRQ